MNTGNRQELRLNRNETIFIEVHSTYPSSTENTRLLICNSVDLSANGIKAQVDEKLPLNAIYQLCIEIHATDERLFLSAEVKWLIDAPIAGEGFFIGLAILDSDGTDVERWKRHIASELDSRETTD